MTSCCHGRKPWSITVDDEPIVTLSVVFGRWALLNQGRPRSCIHAALQAVQNTRNGSNIQIRAHIRFQFIHVYVLPHASVWHFVAFIVAP